MRLPFNPRSHIFKTAGAVAGLFFLRGFGLIFGFIGGALIDQLTAGLRQKSFLKRFLSEPEKFSGSAINPALTAAAGASALWYLCREDPARKELAAASLHRFFPEAPLYCAECLSEHKKINYIAAAGFFGRNAEKSQVENFNNMIIFCGLDIAAARAIAEDGNASRILKAAGFRFAGTVNPEKGIATEADYIILGLKPDASPDEIKRQYHLLAAHFHPDAGMLLSPEQQQITEEAFKRIQAAYERLRGRS